MRREIEDSDGISADARSMKITRGQALLGLAGMSASTALAACAGLHHPADIIVGSKDFTEEQIIAEMYAQLLESHGLNVRRRLGLEGTQVAMAALLRGSIDLYPEYTGTALLVELHDTAPVKPAGVYAQVKREYEARFHATWLAPAPMNDTQALAMTAARARKLHIRSVSDLIAQADKLRLGAVPEFLARPDGIPGLTRVYGLTHFAAVRVLDSGLKYEALAHGDVDVVVAFSTDGRIEVDHLVVLEDDRKLWTEYHIAPVIRQDTLAKFPQVASILNPLAATLTDETMRHLNALVDGEKREVADVARAHLLGAGVR